MGIISYRNRSKGKVTKEGKACRPSWEYRFYGAPVRGKRICFSKAGFPTKAAAIAAGTKAQNEYMSSGTVFQESTMSYSDCLDSWMENYVKIRCAPTTIRNYETYLKTYIRPALGKYRVSAIRHETVQRFILDLYHRRYARSTMVNMLAVVSCSMRYAKRQGWIQMNPAEDIDLPSPRESAVLPSKQRDAIPKEVIARIFERFPEEHPSHLPLMLAYHCGLRKGEVFGLAWDAINLEEGYLIVQRQMQRCRERQMWLLVEPKYNSCRRVRLDPVIWDLLRRTREHQNKRRDHYGEQYKVTYMDLQGCLGEEGDIVEMVITRDDGTFMIPEVVHNISLVVRKELGYDIFDFHSLRHTHATELCENGVNLKEIQRRLGHKNLEVTNRVYLHATDAMERESMEIMRKMYES